MSDSYDALDSQIFESEESNSRHRFEEKVLLCCLLRDMKLVKRNSKLIQDYMFSNPFNGLLYSAMIETIERGAKAFKPKDIAQRIMEVDPTAGEPDPKKRPTVEEVSIKIEKIISSDKEPRFYKSAARFYENWRIRQVNKKFKELLSVSADSDETIEQMEAVLAIRKKPNPFAGNCKSAKEVLHTTLGMLHDIWEGKYVFPKIKTGYIEFDDLLDGGFDVGSLVIMGGATGHGKSATALNLAAKMAELGIKSQYTSLEETYKDVALKIITSQSGVSRRNLVNKDLITPSEQERAQRVMEKFVSDDSLLQFSCGGKTAAEVINLIRTTHEKDGTLVFIVDYAQRITLERDNATAEIARFALALGELARELGLVIIATSQLKREGRKEMNRRKPTTYDLSESSYLENEAAYIITLFRQDLIPGYEERDDYNPDDDGTIELIVCKSRNGQQGSTKLNFDGPSVRLTSRLDGSEDNRSASFIEDDDF